jgi:hypothetical protein
MSLGELTMWKRWHTWAILALIVLLNIVAWRIQKAPQEVSGAITLYQHVPTATETIGAKEYVLFLPRSLLLGGWWVSYFFAAFIGFGLPFILPRLVPWLWRQRQRVRPQVALVWVPLLIVCNFLAWRFIDWPDNGPTVIPLYQSRLGPDAAYLYLAPRFFIFRSPMASYVLAVFIGTLPILVRWLWRLPRPRPGEARRIWNPLRGKTRGAILGALALFAAFNVLAWDWVQSDQRSMVPLVLSETEPTAGRYSRRTLYSGIAPGFVVHSEGVSWGLSFFVGEILPFLLLPVLSKGRRPPPALPLPPVAGAPR